jgi:hypothetical protein
MAEVEDEAKWESGFRTHGDLFQKQTVNTCHYSMTGKNAVVVYFEVEDLDTYQRILDSSETAEAMAFDGIKRETVKIFVLDKQYTP